ncbi:MAG: thioesterase family protein [Candidatus Eremiobacteraeota bacterium]|nr:thioesterase family protein [Candidatus Eremiobacteraeota bacterium]
MTATHETDSRYWNQIGPFGGWIASTLLGAVLDRPESHGVPLSISINFAAAIRAGSFDLRPELLRRNRSTSFWFVRFVQLQDGEEVHCADATIVLAERRDAPSFAIVKPPAVAAPETLAPFDRARARAKWMEAYDMRFVSGDPFAPHLSEDARTIAWVRDLPERALDFRSLLALSDCAFPQIFHRVARFIPISTVSMTVYFHARAEDLAEVAGDFILYDATMRNAYDGFFDESSSLWSRAGKLLATMEQIVWYKVPVEAAKADAAKP